MVHRLLGSLRLFLSQLFQHGLVASFVCIMLLSTLLPTGVVCLGSLSLHAHSHDAIGVGSLPGHFYAYIPVFFRVRFRHGGGESNYNQIVDRVLYNFGDGSA